MYYNGHAGYNSASSQINKMNIHLNSDTNLPLITKKKYNGPFGCSQGTTICLYVFFVILFIIGAAGVGIGVSFYILNIPTSDDSTYKIVGFSVGGFILLVSVLLFIIFACSHASHNGSKKNRVGLSVKNPRNEVSDQPIGALYNDLTPDTFTRPYGYSANPHIQLKSSRINSRRSNRVAASDEGYYVDDYNFRKSAIHVPRIYSSYDQIPNYGPQFESNYYNQEPFPLQRPVTVIKEIHHHHYENPDNEYRKASARIGSMRSARTHILPINNSDEVQTYQLNQSGQLNLLNQNTTFMHPQSPDEQIVTINRQSDLFRPQSRRPNSIRSESINHAPSWVALYNQNNN